MAKSDIGGRGQWLFSLLMTDLCGRDDPFFRPRFLGEQYPTFDYILEVVDRPSYSFFVQVKGTTLGYTVEAHRLRIQVSQDDIHRMVACPAPTYVVGIDVNAIGLGFLLSVNEPRESVASLTTRFGIDCGVLEQLRDEVIAFWSSRNMTLANSRFREQEPDMSHKNEPWFVAERSEALAGALLTSHKDIRVRVDRTHDRGPDLLVEIDAGDPLSPQLFVVEVKGTTSTDPNDWLPGVQPLFRKPGSAIHLPVCVFVANVRDNRAVYAWVAEPQVEAKGATLRFHETGSFQPLDPVAVGDIVDRVRAWYGALANQLTPA